jgi:CRISPR type III-B/RAMP module-associated protein Cmr5
VSSLELRRARFALEKVKSITKEPNSDRYKSELRDLPARLHTAGLGQTVASLLASGSSNPPRQKIYSWLEEWLRQPPIQYPSDRRLIDCIVGSVPESTSLPEYTATSREVRALSTWLKKFAEAFIQSRE